MAYLEAILLKIKKPNDVLWLETGVLWFVVTVRSAQKSTFFGFF